MGPVLSPRGGGARSLEGAAHHQRTGGGRYWAGEGVEEGVEASSNCALTVIIVVS